MKFVKYTLFFAIFISCSDIGDGYNWQKGTPFSFSRTYGTLGYDYGWNVAYSPSDQGIAVVGSQSREINGKKDLWAIKTNKRGLIEWEKTFGGQDNDEGYDVIATSDGGFLFIGYTWSFGNSQQIYLIKTNYNGDLIWEKTYGGIMWEVGNAVVELKDGGYAIAGYTNSPGLSSGNTDILLLKIDPNGDLVWQKAYGNLLFPNHELAYDIIQIEDGGFIVVGARDRYSEGSFNSLVLRLNEKGDLIWEKEFIGEGQTSEKIFNITKSSEGSFFLCASTNSLSSPNIYQPKIIKIDISGNIAWQRTYKSNSRDYHHFKAASTQSGETIIVGTSINKPVDQDREDAFLTKINSFGDIVWSLPYGSSDNDDWGWSVTTTEEENIIFVGSTKSFNSSLFDIYLVGVDINGMPQ